MTFRDSFDLRTGDQGLIQKEAPYHLQLTGRLKELINRAGEKISPLEIDHALLAIDGVGEAVAFGVPEKTYGEVVWAAVVMKGGNKESEKAVEERIKKALASNISKAGHSFALEMCTPITKD